MFLYGPVYKSLLFISINVELRILNQQPLLCDRRLTLLLIILSVKFSLTFPKMF